jgi:hypothetical protein
MASLTMTDIDEETQIAIAKAMSQTFNNYDVDDDLHTALLLSQHESQYLSNTQYRSSTDTKHKPASIDDICLVRHAIAATYDAEYVHDTDFPTIIFSDRSLFIAATFIVAPVSEATLKKLRSSDYYTRRKCINDLTLTAEKNRCFFGAVMLTEHNLSHRLKYRGAYIKSPHQLSKICREQKLGNTFIYDDEMVHTDDIPAFCRAFNVDIELDIQLGIQKFSNAFESLKNRPVLRFSITRSHYPHALDPRT